jgi:hypothetical protein
MTSHFNHLTEAEAERLSLLAEECAEVIQAVTKIQRHGYESYNPDLPDLPTSPTNRDDLAREIGHVYHATQRMLDARDFSGAAVDLSRRQKAAKIAQYLHHQEAAP